MTRRIEVQVLAPSLGGSGTLVVHGHYGRPFLVMASEQGRAVDFESNGMVESVRELLDAGRAKLFCIDAHDAATWSNKDIPFEERARRHQEFEAWILTEIVTLIDADCGGRQDMGTIGVSMGAFQAVLLALRRADLFPLTIGLSGNYDPSSWKAWGEPGSAAYFHNPTAFVPNLEGEHLDLSLIHISEPTRPY